jgi:AbrB family looped-hinge helix DNA binding protein
MKATVSTTGQIVLPAEVRKRLRLVKGEHLSVEIRGDSVVLRPLAEPRRYQTARHPKSGLPVMAASPPSSRKVTAGRIARLYAEIV